MNLLRERGFFPVLVETYDDETMPSRLVQGDLDTFLELAKVMNSPAIFVDILEFDEDEFLYGADMDHDEVEDPDEYEADEESLEDLFGVDLALVDKQLDKFRKYVGEECGVRLALPGPDRLEFEMHPDWYEEFVELYNKTVEKLEEDPDSIREQLEEEED